MALKCTINYNPVAADAPALPIIYEGLSELVQEGHMIERGVKMLVLPDDGVLYAYASNPLDIIGVLCFCRQHLTATAVVSLVYVEPSSRRAGVFTQLWDALLKQLKAENLRNVDVQVHAHNEAGIAALRSVNCLPVVSTYSRIIA